MLTKYVSYIYVNTWASFLQGAHYDFHVLSLFFIVLESGPGASYLYQFFTFDFETVSVLRLA